MADEQLDMITRALRRAWSLGQTYWQQADSEYYSQNRKAYETQLAFQRLVEDTRVALAAKEPEPTEAQVEAAMLTIRAELGVGFLSYSTEKNLAGAVLRAALAAGETK